MNERAMNEAEPEVTSPDHYQGDGIECMDAMASCLNAVPTQDMGISNAAVYWWGCAFKYLWRWPLKHGDQDLLKCMRCISYLRDELAQSQAREGSGNAGAQD